MPDEIVHGSRILILSSHSTPRLSSPVNHQLYAARHGYDYLFDSTPYISASKYDQKYLSIISAMGNHDWIFWVDTDVYFMDQRIKLDQFIPDDASVDFVFCDSPVNNGKRTVLNSGAFLVRNSQGARDFLLAAMATDLATVKSWWDDQVHGLFTKGDQDQIVYLATKRGAIGKSVKIVDYKLFNARYFNYTTSSDQFFAVHLCGEPSKDEQIKVLRRKFDLDPYLLPKGSIDHVPSFQRSIFYQDERSRLTLLGLKLGENVKQLARRIKRKLTGKS